MSGPHVRRDEPDRDARLGLLGLDHDEEAEEAEQKRPARAGLPFVHTGLGAMALLLLLIGGTATFGSWGTLDVRLFAVYVLAAIVLHGASRHVRKAGITLRTLSWIVLAAMAVHTGVLLRVEVLVPLAALAALDLAIHGSDLSRGFLTASRLSKVLAGVATLLMAAGVAGLVLFAADGLILARLATTLVVAWALFSLLAMNRDLRTPRLLLGAAGVFSVTFLLLAAPALPYGPLLAYWALLLSVGLAVLTGAISLTRPGLDPGKVRHAQRVHPIPDPVLAPLRREVSAFVANGVGTRRLSARIETALGRDEGGRLLGALAEAQGRGTVPSRADRIRALAEVLDLDTSRYTPSEESS